MAATSTTGREPATVTVDGYTVAYATCGDPDGTPVLFFHGTPGSRLLAGLYDEAATARGVRLIAPDRPGFGRSDHWPGRELADTAAFVEPILDDAGVESAGVVGFSGGGPHALALASASDRVRGVDLVSTAVPPECVENPPRVQATLDTLAVETPRLLAGLLRGQTWLARNGPASLVVGQFAEDPDRVPDEAAALIRRDFVEALARTRRGTVDELALLARSWDLALSEIGAPVRLWHGERDGNVPVTAARRLVMRLDGPDLTVATGADHLGTLLGSRSDVLDGYVDAG
jgi:pimeloyl-ACP methyl ester carboxylesterase